MERGALADDGVAMLEGDGRWAAAPGGWRWPAARPRPGRPPGCRRGATGRRSRLPRVDRRPDGDQLLDDRDVGAVAERDERPPDQRPIRRADGPADDDRPLQADAGGTWRRRPGSRSRGRAAASLSSSGAAAPPSSSARKPVRVARERRRRRSRGSTPAAVAAGDRARPATPSSRSSIRPATPRGARSSDRAGRGRGPDVRPASTSSALRRSR